MRSEALPAGTADRPIGQIIGTARRVRDYAESANNRALELETLCDRLMGGQPTPINEGKPGEKDAAQLPDLGELQQACQACEQALDRLGNAVSRLGSVNL